jgi:glycosyltransferase involved in cell wall biosynthesis
MNHWRGTRHWFQFPADTLAHFREITKDAPIDLFHAQHCYSFGVVNRLSRATGIPYVISNQSMDEPWQRDNSLWGRAFRAQIKTAHRQAKRVIGVSQAVIDNIGSLGWNLGPQTLVENVVSDAVWNSFSNNLEREFDVIMLGRLAAQKNVLFAMEAFSQLKAQRPSLRVAVLGDGPMREEVESTVRRLGLESNVSLLGQRSKPEVIQFANNSRVFYAPSLWEGLSLAAVEMLGLGLDAVVSTSPSFTKSFPSEEGIQYCDPQDLDGNVRALAASIDNWRPRARPHLKSRFQSENYVSKMSDIYREAARR